MTSDVLAGLDYASTPTGWLGDDGSDAFCFRNELWRLKGWPYEDGPEWNRFPDWLGPEDREVVMERTGLVEVDFTDASDYLRLKVSNRPGLAMFHLRRRTDGAKAGHVAYASSVAMIWRYWNESGLPAAPVMWPLPNEYRGQFDVRLDAVLVDETQDAHDPAAVRARPRYEKRGPAH